MRILKRPMFKKGGSANEGIMNGLVDRSTYAGGGAIGGGTITGTPMGYRTGFQNPLADAAKAALASGNVRGGPTGTTPAGSAFQRGLYGTGDYGRIGKIANWFKNLAKPGFWTGAATRYGLGTLPASYVYGAHKLQESLPEELTGEGGIADISGLDPMAAGADIPLEVDKILRGKEIDIKGELLYPEEVIPPGEVGGPGYVPPIKDKDTGGLEISGADAKAIIADKRSILKKRAKEFAELMSPHATKKMITDVAGAASESFAGSTGDTRQDIVNAITAAAKASGGQREVYDEAMKLAIMEDIQKGLKTNKISESDKNWARYQIANPQEEGESEEDWHKRLIKKMSTGKIPVETKLDFEKAYTNMGETKEDGRIAWAKRTYGGHNDFGGILDPDNMPEQVQGKKYYDPDADNWKDHKSEITTPPGE